MLTLNPSKQYRKDVKRMMKRGADLSQLEDVLDVLTAEQPLDPKYHDHALTGDYAGHRECHILPDWLLIYTIDGDNLILTTTRTGSHSDLF